MTDTPAPRMLAAWLLAWVVLAAGCAPADEPPLRVGTYPWPGFATLHHARALGRLDPARVQLVDFDTAGQVMQALREGRIDAAGLALNEALVLAREMRGARVVLAFGQSAGGDSLLARPSITRIEQLKGRRVGVEREAEGGYMLARILDRAGLKAGDLEILDLSLEEHEQAYRSGRLDAVITMDPVRARLLAAGAQELFSSKQIAGELVDLLLIREGIAETRPRALQSVVEAHFLGLDSIRDDPARAAAQLPQRFGPQQQLQASWALIEFSGRGANLRLLERGGLRRNAEQVAEVMQRSGLAEAGAPPHIELDPRFVANVGG